MSDAGMSMLRAFHARHAGGATDAFAPGDAGDGRNSYEHLLDHVPPGRRVLDAGCGDGFLLERLAVRRTVDAVGVDMSPEELSCARARLPEAELIEAMLHDVPLPDGDLDAVISHMVLMLITDIEPALAELRRLLKPDGALVAVVGRTFGMAAPQKELTQRMWTLLDAESGPPPSVGDRRFRTVEGLRELFGGWTSLQTHPLDVSVPVPRAALIGFLKTVWYGMDALSDDGWTDIDRWIDAEAESILPDGVFTWTFGARIVVATR